MRGYLAVSGQRSAVSKNWLNATQHPALRPAFTLVELIVSVAILLALMAMIGMVFSTAGKASGTAQASTALYRQLRQITESIRQDLAAVDPAKHVMAIAGVTTKAYGTADDMANKGPTDLHRADVFMLLTPREFQPFAYSGSDTFESFRQVIYGHANLGRINPANGTWLPNTRMIEGSGSNPSVIPAAQWHLARRIVGFTKLGFSSPFPNNTGGWPLTNTSFTGDCGPLAYADVYRGDWNTFYDSIWPGYFHYTLLAADTVFCSNPAHTNEQFLRGSSYCYLWDVTTHKWYAHTTANNWMREVVGGSPPQEYVTTSQNPPELADFDPATPGGVQLQRWPYWYYTGGASRLVLDPNPPVAYGQRIAGYFLPGCADFQVEYTYDDPREIALDSTSKTREPVLADWLDQNVDGTLEKYPAPRPIQWQMVENGEQVVWSKLSVDPHPYPVTTGNVDLRDRSWPNFCRWPRAVRITIRVFDPSHRLTEPVTQTIVHTF